MCICIYEYMYLGGGIYGDTWSYLQLARSASLCGCKVGVTWASSDQVDFYRLYATKSTWSISD